MDKALIILSGGLDSTTLLYDIVNQYGAENVVALSFNYGSKHNAQELAKALKSCTQLSVKHEIISLQEVFRLFNSALLEGGEEVPKGHYEEENMKKTVVPFRNGILLSLAVGYAESQGIDKVFYGAHSGDHAIYPDCREEFIKAISSAAKTGTYNEVQIIAPYTNMNKISILEKGQELGVDYSNTWTCYDPQDGKPCGKCGSCTERTEAFVENFLVDPLYDLNGWEEAKEYYQKVKK
jgi:7-cyano-7-deazaguanine synthase